MSGRTVFDNRTVVKLAPKHIDIGVEYELQYWCRALGVSRDDLIAAVKIVGAEARAVSRQLGKG